MAAPYVTVNERRIRIPPRTRRELVPDQVTPGGYSAGLWVDSEDDPTVLAISFHAAAPDPPERYPIFDAGPSVGLTVKGSDVISAILSHRQAGHYACGWNDDRNLLVVDLTQLQQPI